MDLPHFKQNQIKSYTSQWWTPTHLLPSFLFNEQKGEKDEIEFRSWNKVELLSYRNNHSVKSMAFKALTAGISWKEKVVRNVTQGRYKDEAAGEKVEW